MTIPSHALQAAAGAMQQISDANPGARGRRATIVALVLRAIQQFSEDGESADFLVRRAESEIERVESRAERSYLRRILDRLIAHEISAVCPLLMDYAADLEEARRLPEADAVLALARSLEPTRADVALRAGRIARLQGDHDRALELYAVARTLDGGDGPIARLSAIGEAVAEGSERALTRGIRAAVLAGDHEAAGVGLEERGRLRRSAGNRRGAARDFAIAAGRYGDNVDRARVAHLLADLYIAGNDPLAAREALLLALAAGDRSQRDHAHARLHTLSRDLGDQVGMRRWRSFERPTLVSLSGRRSVPDTRSSAPKVARWRERLARVAPPS